MKIFSYFTLNSLNCCDGHDLTWCLILDNINYQLWMTSDVSSHLHNSHILIPERSLSKLTKSPFPVRASHMPLKSDQKLKCLLTISVKLKRQIFIHLQFIKLKESSIPNIWFMGAWFFNYKLWFWTLDW